MRPSAKRKGRKKGRRRREVGKWEGGKHEGMNQLLHFFDLLNFGLFTMFAIKYLLPKRHTLRFITSVSSNVAVEEKRDGPAIKGRQ